MDNELFAQEALDLVRELGPLIESKEIPVAVVCTAMLFLATQAVQQVDKDPVKFLKLVLDVWTAMRDATEPEAAGQAQETGP